MSYLTEVLELKNFINGQLELYEIEFTETGKDKYLKAMNEFRKSLETINKMDSLIIKLNKEKKQRNVL